jgi:uncharacterized protein
VSTLDNLRRDAKRWLRAIRAGDAEAIRRLYRAHAHASNLPGLRDVQHAVAREHGFESWAALKTALERATAAPAAVSALNPDARVAAFLEAASPHCDVRGPGSRRSHLQAAMRLLALHPDIARANFFTAVVCGDLDEVTRALAIRPAEASEPGGPHGWPALLYLCNARLSIPAVRDHAVAIARALLDAGADPNAKYILHGSEDYPYSALTGVLGRGEEEAQTHPEAEALTRLLFERGAEPYDTQLLYNVFADNSSRALLGDDMVWLLDLIYEHAVQRGRIADWNDPEWPMLDPWQGGRGAAYLLEAAVDRNLLTMAEWLLAHGAGPNATRPASMSRQARTPYRQAQRKGLHAMMALLARFGAAVQPPEAESDDEAFIAACFRLDRAHVASRLGADRQSWLAVRAMFAAARHDRADVVELLIDLGVSPDIENADQGHARPLHEAAGADAARVIALLVERGADVDARESNWNATPMGFAVFGCRERAIAALARASRDVFNLAATGSIDRLRQVLDEEPALAVAVNSYGATPLMRLPDDDGAALAIVELLLAHGADASVRTPDGRTATDIALERGLDAAAERLLKASAS